MQDRAVDVAVVGGRFAGLTAALQLATSVPEIFAAGDCARPAHSVTLALGDGAAAGVGCHQSLLFPDMIQPLEITA